MSRNYSLGKAARTNVSERALKNSTRILHLGVVIESDDQEAAAGRIKVRIKGMDDNKLDSEIPYCWPFLPLYLNIQPRKDETVKVFLYQTDNETSYREYIGPIIPQLGEKLLGARNFDEAKAGREGSIFPFLKSIFKIPTAKDDLYPKYDEIAIQGRDNADLVFKKSEVLIRAAKFLPDEPTVKNEKNPAYIQIKSLIPGLYKEDPTLQSTQNRRDKIFLNKKKTSETRTDIKMVSNKIYLIGRDSESAIVKPFMTDEEQSKIEEDLHPIVYGDILLDFIEKIFNWIQGHTHPYHNVPQNPANDAFIQLQYWKTTELPKLVSKNIFAGGDIPTNKISIQEGITNQTDENIFVRDNSGIVRVDEQDQPTFRIDSSKVCDDTKCLVEFKVINKIDESIILETKGEGSNQFNAYVNAVTNLTSQLLLVNVDITKIKIPPLNNIKTF